MMISPEGYKEGLVGMDKAALIAERDRLMRSIRRFEKKPPREEDYLVHPDPDIRYQMELLYLAKACEALSEEHNRIVNEDDWLDC